MLRRLNYASLAVGAVVGLFLGYWMGRWHLSVQIASALQDGIASFNKGLADARSGAAAKLENESETPEKASLTLPVTIERKDYIEPDASKYIITPQIELVFSVNNNTGKSIVAVEGSVAVFDEAGNELQRYASMLTDPIPPGGAGKESGTWGVGNEWMKVLPKEKLTAVFQVQKIQFEGEKIQTFTR
jgi:hypothetical protein